MNGNRSSILCAIRGPIVLITLGVLFTLDHFGQYEIWRTWPVLLIVIGVLKLLERTAGRPGGSGTYTSTGGLS